MTNLSLMRATHAADPAADLRAAVGNLDGIELFHNQILVATYKRPEKTAGGVYLTDSIRKEDEYQGKVGLVLKKGPLAFVDDASVKFAGQNVAIGDWITYRASDGWALTINGVHCRMVEDSHIRMRVAAPDLVY